jgi:CO/xanthine dehydrogenase Mo-binding subunit
MQGIGMASLEAVKYKKDGHLITNNMAEYKIPNAKYVKKFSTEFAESYEPSGPFGAKSVGEIGIDTPPAALANAIYHACGVRIVDLPITPEKIYQAIQKQKETHI